MFQINPQEKFPIVRQLPNPADTTTYYIQAVVRNAVSGKTIATVNLTQNNGTQRYSNYWEANTQDGIYIDISTYVYADSAHTQLSQVYDIENDTYLVSTRWAIQYIPAMSNAAVDYNKIQVMLKEIVGNVKEIPGIDLSPIHSRFDDLKESIDSIEFPMPRQADLAPVIEGIENVHRTIKSLPKPEKQKPVDLSPVIGSLDKAHSLIKDLHEKNSAAHSKTLGAINDSKAAHDSSVKKLIDTVTQLPYSVLLKPDKEDQKSLERVSRLLKK